MSRSRIFSLILISFVAGIFLYSVVKTPPIVIGGVLVFGLAVLVIAVIKKDSAKIIFGICILFFVLGVWRSYDVFGYAGKADIKNFNSGEEVSFSGKITREPDRRLDFSQYILESESLGYVLVKTNLYPEYFYGDTLKIKGKIQKPENFTGFDYQNYLAKDNIFLISRYPKINLVNRPQKQDFYGRLLDVKKSFVSVINKLLPEPHASFLSALLVGAKRTLPADLVDNFNRTGTSHIIAISGYNISIISVMLLNFFGYLLVPRRISFWIVGVSLVLFTLVAGAGASVVRAAIMGGLLILAKREGRFYNITNTIILAGAAMLFLNPYLLRYDASFQLSFLATFGLVYLAPRFNERFARLSDFLSFRTNLAATLSAQIMTLPIILFSFNRFSLIAPLANVLILPIVPPTMLFGFLAGLIGLISLKIAMIFIFPAWLMLSYQIFIVKILSLLPFASISL